MTLRIKVQVRRKTVIKSRFLPAFPAHVSGQAFVKVAKANGNYIIYPDVSDIDSGPVSTPANARVLLYDSAYGVWRAVALESLLVSGLDLDLQAIAALAGTGLLARTSDNSWSLRQLVQPASGLTIANPDAVSGDPTISLANDLAALEALSGTDTIYYRSGVDTWSAVTIGSLLSWSGGTLNIGDPELVALAGLTSAADKLPYYTGPGAASLANFTPFARSLVDDSDAATMRATLGSTTVGDAVFVAASAAAARSAIGVVIGTNVQAWDADLDAFAALSSTGILRRTGAAAYTAGTAVANAELATMAAGTIKGNVSGSTAAPSDITPSQVIDVIGSTRGAVLYRGSSGWSALTPGTSGQVLTTAGAGADPSWQDSTGGGGSLSDTDRRNALLDRIYQSKLLGTPRRVVNAWATGFKAATDADRGINTGVSSNIDASAAAASGYVKPSVIADTYATQSSVAHTNSSGSMGGRGMRTVVSTSAYGSSSDGDRIRLTLCSGTPALTLTAVWVGHKGSGTQDFDGGQVQVTFGGSNSVTIPATSSFVLSDPIPFAFDHTKSLVISYGIDAGSTEVSWVTNVNFQSYVKTSAASEAPWSTVTGYTSDVSLFVVTKIEVRTAVGSVNSMTLVTAAQTTDANVGNARALIEYDNVDTPTLNTDLTAEVTCDGGTNWSAATLSAVTAYSQGGRSVAETADTACTAGTSFAARVKTANGKSVPIYGTSITVH